MTIRKPLIAAINGPCAGIGLVQALYCDIRIVSNEAKLTTAFARHGLIAEHGISWILPRIVGLSRALDLLLSASVVRGTEAAEMGLGSFAVAPGEVVSRAQDYAHKLAVNCSPRPMATIKQQLYSHLDVDLAQALDKSNAHLAASLSWPDLAEGCR